MAGLGGGVTGVAVGDEVFGLIDFDRDGAAAEFTTVRAAELAAKPRTASHAETATLPLAALTAWQALVDYAALEPGERVLVHGGGAVPGGFDVVIDTVGGAVLDASYQLMRAGGRLVTLGAPPSAAQGRPPRLRERGSPPAARQDGPDRPLASRRRGFPGRRAAARRGGPG